MELAWQEVSVSEGGKHVRARWSQAFKDLDTSGHAQDCGPTEAADGQVSGQKRGGGCGRPGIERCGEV